MSKGESHIHPTLSPNPMLSTRDSGSMGNLMASVNCSLTMDPISMALSPMALFKAKEDSSPIPGPITKGKSGIMWHRAKANIVMIWKNILMKANGLMIYLMVMAGRSGKMAPSTQVNLSMELKMEKGN